MIIKILSILVFALASLAGPIIVRSEAGQSEYSILFARAHLDELLSVCSNDECNLSEDQESWLRTARQLSLNAPKVIFKNKTDLADQKFTKHDDQVWLNQDLLWLDDAHTIAFQVSDAMVLWLDILLQGKIIPRLELTVLEFEMARVLNEKVQTIRSAGEFSAILWRHADRNDEIFFEDHTQRMISIRDSLQKSGFCGNDLATSLQFHSASWNDLTTRKEIRLEVATTWSCGVQKNRGNLQIMAELNDQSEVDPSSIRTFIDEE